MVTSSNDNFTPLPAINFDTTWGRDADPEEGQAAKPLDQTSPGHNVEFAWLLLHAADVLGVPRADYAHVVRPIFEHCLPFDVQRLWDELDGIDWGRIWTAERDQEVWDQLQD